MCLGVPARIIAIADEARMLATAEILGVRREVNIACVAEDGAPLSDCIGLWVLVHVGFAVARIDEDEARVTLDLFRQMGEVEAEIELMRASQETSQA
jgi:hydrogenase expression/formation protein HypC